jgi:hypothetical protein
MLVPSPDRGAASPHDRAVPDDRRIFTTACVLTAIFALRSRDGELR